MNIALIGYGKMGKEIEKVAIARNHHVPVIIDINNTVDLSGDVLKKVNVAIEFSNPGSVVDNILKCFVANTPVVCGTTGWMEHFEYIRQQCLSGQHAFFYSSNYSLGMNIFFKLNQFLARVMNNFDQYEVEIEETHHIQKLDAPSGTAITLANDIIKSIERKNNWKLNTQEHEDELKINAIRRDTVPGIHTIKYESVNDFIEMTHSAKSRQGLALGAVLAAEFLIGKKGVYSMDDLLKI